MSKQNITIAPRRRNRKTTVVVDVPKTTANRNRRRRKKALKKEMTALNRLPLATNNVKLRPCTAEYAVALVDPFGSRKTDPCIPDSIVLPSNKLQTKVRVTMQSGANGTGFVLFDPWHMAWNDGGIDGTVTSAPVLYTDASYPISLVNTTIVAGAFVNPGIKQANSNSPFQQADYINNGRQLRLVAAGLRVQYTGSNFRNQGQVYLARTQSNVSFPNLFDIALLTQDNYTSIVPVSRKSEYTFYTPDTHDLLSYHPADYFDAADGGNNRFAYAIVIVGADLEAPQSWSVEAISYFEIIGSGLTLTKSHGDPEGMAAAQESMPVRNPTVPPGKVVQSVLGRMISSLTETGRELLPIAAKYGVPALASYITGNPAPMIANYAANNYNIPGLVSQPMVEEVD